jgi:putative phosphoesterase
VKIGIVSDIHCNLAGLTLALEHMRSVDEIVCAGDSIYQYRFSNDVVALLRDVGARMVLGNHERTLLSPAGTRARTRPGIDPTLVAWLAEQPSHLRVAIGRKHLFMTHGSPWAPYDEYIYPGSPRLARCSELDADYVILGHTHYQMALDLDHQTVINPGSAGEARDLRNDFQLSCAILDTGSGEVQFIDYPDPTRALDQRPLPTPK